MHNDPSVNVQCTDYFTHHNDWVKACKAMLDEALNSRKRYEDDSDILYWEKQLRTLTNLAETYGEHPPMQKLYVNPLFKDAKFPVRSTTHAACHDVFAYVHNRSVTWFTPENEPDQTLSGIAAICLMPGERAIIGTGLRMCCDADNQIKVHPRSGISIKMGISMVNSEGIIDADYRGEKDEVCILLINHSSVPFFIHHGDKLAQIEIQKVYQTEIIVGEFPALDSNRTGGLGSTGTRTLKPTLAQLADKDGWISVDDALPEHEADCWSEYVEALCSNNSTYKIAYSNCWQRTNAMVADNFGHVVCWRVI